jgi:lipopolysaccharide export system protein LptA
MRLSVERLRWGLLAGALLLVGVVVVLLSYGRYRAIEAWRQIVKRSGATITHETNGVTWSQAVRGKQIFTLHGKRVIPHGEGKYTLEDGMLLLYGANGQPADRISGAQFEYDEKQGVAHAAGVVDMEIEPPAGLLPQGPGSRVQGPEGQATQAIHVRTSGLTYVKKLGVAATDQDVEIEYAGMHGHARGAEFDTGQSVVHLLADVRAEGMLRGAVGGKVATPATLTATKADLDRDENVIHLTAPVIRTGGRTGSAESAVLHLRKDGTVELVEASGAVTLKQDTRTITAATLRAAMNERSQLQHAELGGGVALLDTNAQRPMHAVAETAKITCDAAGYPTAAVMNGAVALTMEDRRGGGQAFSPQRTNSLGTPAVPSQALARQVGAEHVTLTMERVARQGHKGGGSRVSAVHAQGGAWARGSSVVRASGSATAAAKPGGLKLTSVAGDDLRLALTQDAEGKDQPQSLSGNGHTRIEQRMPDGTVQTSTGDLLEASFAQGQGRGLEIASAEQTGNVEIRSVPGRPGEPSEGLAERAQFDGASDVLTLTSPQRASSSGTPVGRPRLTRGDTSVTADTVRMMQQTGDSVASGNVAATFVNANAKAGAGSGSGVTHAIAEEAVLHRTVQTMELKGTDAAPARMWQGASQVEAANLLLDRGKDSLQAWPNAPTGVVRSVFAQNQGSPAKGPGSKAEGPGPRAQGPEGQRARVPEGRSAGGSEGQRVRRPEGQSVGGRVVRVTSARLDYSGISHEAVFTGGVTAEAEDGTVRAQRGVAFLSQGPGSRAQGPEGQGASHPAGQRTAMQVTKAQPDPVASTVERIVMSGAVKVEQPGRTATGDQLLYTAATGEFVLTGTAGHPPHVVDDKQGSITGATLLFRSPDSTIVVAGESASRRVHTETTIKK